MNWFRSSGWDGCPSVEMASGAGLRAVLESLMIGILSLPPHSCLLAAPRPNLVCPVDEGEGKTKLPWMGREIVRVVNE